ncbi:hypothetical protein EJ06DRAFT_531385 [Trichodelitschia bisporula]|uniref:Uncharacterized protein n=1 Tax=Trichodelitschia bisporula TaxID=703511 RepID=A0A6G1HT42_9PEZI|nr:hypothetical protein EJ06DRAFT_531385 [Trichodelitschia bisporula]
MATQPEGWKTRGSPDSGYGRLSPGPFVKQRPAKRKQASQKGTVCAGRKESEPRKAVCTIAELHTSRTHRSNRTETRQVGKTSRESDKRRPQKKPRQAKKFSVTHTHPDTPHIRHAPFSQHQTHNIPAIFSPSQVAFPIHPIAEHRSQTLNALSLPAHHPAD